MVLNGNMATKATLRVIFIRLLVTYITSNSEFQIRNMEELLLQPQLAIQYGYPVQEEDTPVTAKYHADAIHKSSCKRVYLTAANATNADITGGAVCRASVFSFLRLVQLPLSTSKVGRLQSDNPRVLTCADFE